MKQKLWVVDEVLLKHGKYVNIYTAGQLTCCLAKLAFFVKKNEGMHTTGGSQLS